METALIPMKFLMILIVLLSGSCAELDLTPETEEAGIYYVTMKVDGVPFHYDSGVQAVFDLDYDASASEYNWFNLSIKGSGSFSDREAFSLHLFGYEQFHVEIPYINDVEPDENGRIPKKENIALVYINESLAQQYYYLQNNGFETGSAQVLFEEVTTKSVKGTFHSVLKEVLDASRGVRRLAQPIVIEGEFFAPIE